VQSAQDIVSIIQHAFSLTITSDGALLTVRKLIFRHYTLYLVRLDAVSKTSVRLDRHTLNDGVNLRRPFKSTALATIGLRKVLDCRRC